MSGDSIELKRVNETDCMTDHFGSLATSQNLTRSCIQSLPMPTSFLRQVIGLIRAGVELVWPDDTLFTTPGFYGGILVEGYLLR